MVRPPKYPSFDRNETERFLALLDPTAGAFTFQTFDDNADRKNKGLAKIMSGSVDDVYPDLERYSRSGAGVFATINQTDLKGRKKENIVRVRAVWFEDDSGKRITPPIAPHITVESSPDKFHHYFLLEDASKQDFEELQTLLVACGSDPNAQDISRVLRLPGFCHQKVDRRKGLTGNPFMVRIIGGTLT